MRGARGTRRPRDREDPSTPAPSRDAGRLGRAAAPWWTSTSRTTPRVPAASRAAVRNRSSRTAATTGGPAPAPSRARRANSTRTTSASAASSSPGSTRTQCAAAGVSSARAAGSVGAPVRQTTRMPRVIPSAALRSEAITAESRSASTATAPRTLPAWSRIISPTTVNTWSDQPSTTACPFSSTLDRPRRSSSKRSPSPVVITPTRVDTSRRSPTRSPCGVGWTHRWRTAYRRSARSSSNLWDSANALARKRSPFPA